jgi:hypothetical protein
MSTDPLKRTWQAVILVALIMAGALMAFHGSFAASSGLVESQRGYNRYEPLPKQVPGYEKYPNMVALPCGHCSFSHSPLDSGYSATP